jgi:hypothetical protein
MTSQDLFFRLSTAPEIPESIHREGTHPEHPPGVPKELSRFAFTSMDPKRLDVSYFVACNPSYFPCV